MDQHGKSSLAALTLGAIGVVYGDIGTSVLYAMKEVFGSGHVDFTPDNIFGILSIFFWTLTIIVSIKYVAWCCVLTTTAKVDWWPCWPWPRWR